MGTYEDIQTDIDSCITILTPPKFTGGSLGDIQTEILNIVNTLGDLNDYIKSIDDRVIILEGA